MQRQTTTGGANDSISVRFFGPLRLAAAFAVWSYLEPSPAAPAAMARHAAILSPADQRLVMTNKAILLLIRLPPRAGSGWVGAAAATPALPPFRPLVLS